MCRGSRHQRKWESDNFIRRGVTKEHQKDVGFLMSQSEFVNELQEVQIPSHRRKAKDSSVSQQEQTELREIAGWSGLEM